MRLVLLLLVLASCAMALKQIGSDALKSCMTNSQFTASRFDIKFFPDNGTANIDMKAISNLDGNITGTITLKAYGIEVVNQKVDFCKNNMQQLCPIAKGNFDFSTTISDIGKDIVGQIPGIAYTIPDLDGVVTVKVHYNDNPNVVVACVETSLSNGKTVQTKIASWVIAGACLIGLLTAGVVAIMGHSNTAAHVASNAVSLFTYFQAIAIISMMAVEKLPPIAAAWSSNFTWTLGLVNVKFMQNIFNWFVQATGGTSTFIIKNRQLISVSVEKRSLYARALQAMNDERITDFISSSKDAITRRMASRGDVVDLAMGVGMELLKRDNSTMSLIGSQTENQKDPNIYGKTLIVRGIERVAFLSKIELTNVFLTGFTMFAFVGFILVFLVIIFKITIENFIKIKIMSPGKFEEYRQNWKYISKGAMYRMALIGWPQMSVLCLWELIERDSAAVVVIAVVTFLTLLFLLAFGGFKIIMMAKRSMSLYRNPAYMLYGDPVTLHKWGFLYVNFRATAFYYVLVIIGFHLARALVIAFGQKAGKVQGVVYFVIELVYLVVVSWIKPYMDKTTNVFNIAVASIMFINALFYMFFSQVFGQPLYVGSIMAVVFFVLNAAFSLILMISVIVSSVRALISKDPDLRYQPMRDDRVSFIPHTEAEKAAQDTELDALGATMMVAGEDVNRDQNRRYSSDDDFPRPRLPRDTLAPHSGYERPVSGGPYDERDPFALSNHSVNSDYTAPAGSGAFYHQRQNDSDRRVDYPPPATSYRGYQPPGY